MTDESRPTAELAATCRHREITGDDARKQWGCVRCGSPFLPAARLHAFHALRAASRPVGEEGLREALATALCSTFDLGHDHEAFLQPDHCDEGLSDADEMLPQLRAALAAKPTPEPEGLDVERLLDKAKRWREDGMMTDAEYGAVCAVIFVRDPRDMTDEERTEVQRRGRELAEQHGWLAQQPETPEA